MADLAEGCLGCLGGVVWAIGIVVVGFLLHVGWQLL